MKNYVDFPIEITQDEITTFCAMAKDRNPQHLATADRVVVPGILTLAKSLGETDTRFWQVWLVEERLKFRKPIYLDESIVVRHTLTRERKTPQGIFQYINIDVMVNTEIRYNGSMTILKVSI